jgi:hypothetical protein
VSFTAPASDGGSAITGYTVTATDALTPANGGQTATGTSSPITITGLTNGDNYTFTAHATNAAGNGAESAPSNAVTPAAPVVQQPAPNPSPSQSVSPSPSASASSSSSTSPSASSSSSSSAPARQALTLSVRNPLIPAGSTATLTATGAANQAYELRCYTRPSTTYVTSHPGTFNAVGDPVQITLSLGRNTRCFIQYSTNSAQGASPSAVINVRTVLSLSTVRTAVRTYVFQGRNLPRVAGQLITLYRVDNAGNEIRTSNLTTDDTSVYRVSRTFTGKGIFRFRVGTSQTLNNAPGDSNTITVNVH